jgi:hypothetical protein
MAQVIEHLSSKFKVQSCQKVKTTTITTKSKFLLVYVCNPRLKQENGEFKASLAYIVRPCSQCSPASKQALICYSPSL